MKSCCLSNTIIKIDEYKQSTIDALVNFIDKNVSAIIWEYAKPTILLSKEEFNEKSKFYSRIYKDYALNRTYEGFYDILNFLREAEGIIIFIGDNIEIHTNINNVYCIRPFVLLNGNINLSNFLKEMIANQEYLTFSLEIIGVRNGVVQLRC